MRVLLLSAYDADSHRSWWKGLGNAFSHWDWTVLTLPPRYFSWRVRGNSLSWAFQHREAFECSYDLLIATSMTDLSALRGFVPSLAKIPTIVYFHENQFDYPNSQRVTESVEPQILNLYTALCADHVLFNSNFNRDTFLSGAADLLRRLPDQVPKGIVERLTRLSSVLPVPLANECYEVENTCVEMQDTLWGNRLSGQESVPVRLLWAARWEYDKGPDLLLAILQRLRARDIEFKLCLLGQKFRQSPETFAQIEQQFGSELVQYGYEPSLDRYHQWLGSADMVLSTAIHEFQGLAVLEAMAAGCTPVLPNRLAYPELVDERFLYQVEGLSVESQAAAAVDLIAELSSRSVDLVVPDLSWSRLQPHYQHLIETVISERNSSP